MPKLNDITRGILGNHYDDVSSYLSNPFNLPSLSRAGLVTMADASRAASNPDITDRTELKILRGRTQATKAILDSGVSVDSYYGTLTRFYSTPAGRALGPELDRWARNPNVTQAEIATMSRRVFNSARDGMSQDELAGIRRDMDLQDNPAQSTLPPTPPREKAAPATLPDGNSTNRRLNKAELDAFERKLNVFSRDPDVTPEEEQYMRNLIARERNDGGGITIAERDAALVKMRRFDRTDGNQLNARERAEFESGPPPATQREPVRTATPVETAAPIEPPPPPPYSPPDQLNAASYDTLMLTLGGQMKRLMPEGMAGGNDADGFFKKLEDPAFRDEFIRLYNSDPQYRQAIQLLYRDSAKLAEMKGKSGGELDPDSEIGRRAGLLTGQFRTVISNPEDLLNVNKVMELQQGVSGLANFAGSMSGMLDQMPPWLKGLLAPVWDFIENVIGPLFSKQGLNEGLAVAGNAAGQLFNSFGGGANAGAGSGAPAPRGDLAVADPPKPNVIKPGDGPSPGQHGPGAPVITR